MAISDKIGDFAAAIDAARDELAALNTKLGELEQSRATILQAAPHTGDIAAVLTRALRTSAEGFEANLASFLKSNFEGSGGADKVAQGSASNVLRLQPPRNGLDAINYRMAADAAPAVDLAALSFFLRDKIEAEIPGLVDRLMPAARNGMTTPIARKRSRSWMDRSPR